MQSSDVMCGTKVYGIRFYLVPSMPFWCFPDHTALPKQFKKTTACIILLQRSFMTDRFKTSRTQKALSSQAIVPQLSIWRDFPVSTWLKSLQQQHFVSSLWNWFNSTSVRLHRSEVTLVAPESPDESEGHVNTKEKRTQNRKPNEMFSTSFDLWFKNKLI